MPNDNKLVTLADLGEAYNDLDSRKKEVQTAVTDPTASGTAVSFIDSISQDAQGVITPTKKTVRVASQSESGLMSAEDKIKLDDIESGAEVNIVDSVNGATGDVVLDADDVGALPNSTVFVSGVKGDAETSYRSGQVNLTPANIGAVDKAGDTMTGNLVIETSHDAYVQVKDIYSGAKIYLDVVGNGTSIGKHGVWSDGYYTGSAFMNHGKFIISRDASGKVIVADHYDKDEVNARGVLYTDSNIGNVTVNSGGYLDITSKIPSGITPIAVLIKTFGTATGAINVTADGKYIIGAPNTTVTDVVMRYYYRG